MLTQPQPGLQELVMLWNTIKDIRITMLTTQELGVGYYTHPTSTHQMNPEEKIRQQTLVNGRRVELIGFLSQKEVNSQHEQRR